MLAYYLTLIVDTLENPTRHSITNNINRKKDCDSNFDWQVFTQPYSLRNWNIRFNCDEKLKRDQLKMKIEQEENRRRQIFRERIENVLTASSILRDFYSGRYKKRIL